MDVLTIEPTESSPSISLNHNTNRLVVTGESRPEDVRTFFTPVMEWLDSYNSYLYFLSEKFPEGETKTVNVDFILEYFNSSSAKFLLDMVNKLDEIQTQCKGVEFNINWHYEGPDEDMYDAGKEFENLTDLKFNFVIIED